MNRWKHGLIEKLLDLNDIQKYKINKKFICHQAKDDPELLQKFLKKLVQCVLLELDKEMKLNIKTNTINSRIKRERFTNVIMFQNDVSECYNTHRILVKVLKKHKMKNFLLLSR